MSFFPIFATDREGTPEQPSDKNNVVTYEGPPVTGTIKKGLINER